MTQQPVWKMVGQVGDINPIDHSGGFIYIDETGVYPPEVEYIHAPTEYNGEPWVIYRFILEPCTYINGVLSDNKFHPDKPAWFAKTEEERKERPQDTTYLKNVCDFVGMAEPEMIDLFTSDDPQERAAAWMAVGDYHGFENLDEYPLVFTNEDQVRVRYAEELLSKQTTKGNK